MSPTQTASARSAEPGDVAASPPTVLLSASVPDEIAGTAGAQRVYDLVAALVRALLGIGARLVFGGHPTITPLVHRLAREHRGRPPRVALYQLERFRGIAPPEASDIHVLDEIYWLGDPAADMAADLAILRAPMVERADAAVFIAGKTRGFRGAKPGIRDELERFRAQHPAAPAYLVGAAGGETARLIAEAASGGVDWERNGLADPARRLIHDSDDPQLVAALIARDLRHRRPSDPS